MQKIQSTKENLNATIIIARDDLKAKIDELDKFTTEQFDIMSTNMEKFKVFTKETIDVKDKILTERLNKDLS